MKRVNAIPICIGWLQYFTIFHSNSSTHPQGPTKKKRKVQPTPASLTNPRWRLHRPRLSARRWPWTRKPGSPAGLEFLLADFHWQRRCQDSVDPPICHVPGMHGEEAANTTWHLCLHPCLFQTKIFLTFQVEMGWGWRDSISTIAVLYTVYHLSSKCIKTDMIHWYIYTCTYVCVWYDFFLQSLFQLQASFNGSIFQHLRISGDRSSASANFSQLTSSIKRTQLHHPFIRCQCYTRDEVKA